jgi:hypothetical protein
MTDTIELTLEIIALTRTLFFIYNIHFVNGNEIIKFIYRYAIYEYKVCKSHVLKTY